MSSQFITLTSPLIKATAFSQDESAIAEPNTSSPEVAAHYKSSRSFSGSSVLELGAPLEKPDVNRK